MSSAILQIGKHLLAKIWPQVEENFATPNIFSKLDIVIK
jgi:hypothetical protein